MHGLPPAGTRIEVDKKGWHHWPNGQPPACNWFPSHS